MDQAIFPYVIFWSLGLLAYAAEWLFPARSVPYRSVFLKDLTALGLYSVFFMLVLPVTNRIPIPNYAPMAISKLPMVYKLFLFYVVEDFGLYWVHRLMHTQSMWRTHKWHHYPTYMYWLAGIRATIPHIVLFNIAFVAALPVLNGASGWVYQLIAAEHILRNNWMHMNVTWRSTWLEWLIVTPRYHHIHHSDNHGQQVCNLGSLLTVWDRMFGTYYDPDQVHYELSFGIGETVPPVRLVLGI